MNVSGLKIDVGNTIAQTSSTWSIPNIYVTPIPQNPTNTQMQVFEGPGGTPEISSKANSQYNLPCDFLLNAGLNQAASQEPFGKRKQPTLNIPSGSQAHVGNEKRVYGGNKKGHWKMLLGVFSQFDMEPKGKSAQSQEQIKDCDELHASLPVVHEEKVTGFHHPYASKPKTSHASSSRETIVDDED
ncbi:hypothetical protein O181_028439 [Austropuccinia psidii MF-1]|uniref:Uncharacterized protein n=1 Tax=Austropuccinia psidii MF-1 TaxID=1389203 RepID=A0A9Q3H3K9_9BASI|nr:hypothetical protein [Austropuccinia psidii MF-1]